MLNSPLFKIGLHSVSRVKQSSFLTHTCSRLWSSYRDSDQREELLQYGGGTVDLNLGDHIGVITLNHPHRKNALSGSMMVNLRDIVTELENWKSGKGVILHGAEGTFCSGGDLKLMKAIMDPVKGDRMCQYMQETLTRFYNLPFLSVAVMEGQVLGGGAELAVACDLRVAAPSANIGFVQARMGVSPGWGGGTRLVQLVGRTQALRLLCSGQVYSAQRAKDIRLVDEVMEDSDMDALEQGKNWLASHIRGSPHVTQVAKKVVLAAMGYGFSEALEKERALFATLWGGPAHKDAMTKNIRHK